MEISLPDSTVLPQNSNLKMVDGDLNRYGQKLCLLDSEFDPTPIRCDIFVQADTDGALLGYAVLRETSDGVEITTELSTNRSKGNAAKGCWISGTVYQTGTSFETPVSDSSRPFEGQLMYSAWERSPGDFVISPVDANATDDSPSAATGVWYLYRTAKKLRIEQERWNYCYKDVAIDEVFELAISYVKQD